MKITTVGMLRSGEFNIFDDKNNNIRDDLTSTSAETNSLVIVSAFVLADLAAMSPQIIFLCVVQKTYISLCYTKIYLWDQNIPKKYDLILKTKSLLIVSARAGAHSVVELSWSLNTPGVNVLVIRLLVCWVDARELRVIPICAVVHD